MMNLVSDFMASLKSAPKMTVGVSISQSGLLEVCVLDKVNHNIKNYANRRIKYNAQLKELESVEEFKTQLLSIYQELDIVSNSSVVLSLPNVFFELTSVPMILDNYSIESVLLGNIEQSYLFKKSEPLLSWVELGKNDRNENKTIAYSALQENELTKYLAVFNSLGAKVLSVGNSHFNLINSIKHTQICKKEIETQAPWNAVLITNNSFAIFSMSGDKLIEFVEEPVALRALTSQEEVYATLISSVNSTIQNYVANSVLVISDNDDVDASEVCANLNFHGTKHYLNQNQYASGQIIETSSSILPNYISQITLYAISSVLFGSADEKTINFSVSDVAVSSSKVYSLNIGGVDLDITKEMVSAFTLIFVGIVVFLTLVVWGMFKYLSDGSLKKIETYDNNITSVSKEIGDLKSVKKEEKRTIFNLKSVKKEIIDNNKKEILYFNALSFDIPHSTWITHFFVDSQGAVAIEGKTSSTNNVYSFFKGIKTLIEDSDISLTKLKYASGFQDEILNSTRMLYEFELSNSKYAETDVANQEVVPPAFSDNVSSSGQEKSVSENGKQNTQKGGVPNLPPIEDVKGVDNKIKDTGKQNVAQKNEKIEKLTQDDVAKKEAKRETTKDKSQNNIELPELPNFEN